MIRRAALTRPEAMVLAALTLWSLLPFAVLFLSFDGDLVPAIRGGVFNGSDGIAVPDHLQYMAWLRDAGEHILFSNLFDTVPDPHLFLHPTSLLSGLLWKLGASIQLSYLAWKPIALAALFVGFAAYVRRLIQPEPRVRALALGLALFFFTPATALVEWLGPDDSLLAFGTLVMGLEMFPAGYLWGGFGGTLAIAAVPLFLLGAERVLDPSRRASGRSQRWYAVATGVAGAIASWLHPWQGLTLLVIVAGLVAWGRFDRRYFALGLPVALTVAPIAYYFALSHTDSAWAAVSQPNDYRHFGMWFIASTVPLLLAVPGLREPADDLQERMLRLWPLAALVVYFGLRQSWFYHAFVGISLPLAILAVRGWRGLRVPRWLPVGAVLAVTLPGMVWVVLELRKDRHNHFFTSSEGSALEYLDGSPREGGVLAPLQPLGQAVPAFTGRKTWVGHYTWSPSAGERSARADALFSGRLDGAEARRLVRESRARFLASDCRARADLEPLLRPMLLRVRRFGCATVYELRQAQRTSPPSARMGSPSS